MDKDNITKKDIKELRNLALSKKTELKYKSLLSSINGEYRVRLIGMGYKTIRLDIFLDYETILANKTAGGLEETIYNKLMELPKPKLNTRLGND